MISYADNHEDVLLRRAFPHEPSGFYIDVGAFDPVEHSVTKHFYDRGWRGVNIEPNPRPFARLQNERTRDVNLNLGLSDRDGEITIYDAPSACWSVDMNLITGWFGANREDVIARQIRVTTLAKVCEDHVPEGVPIDFLKVDVEGHEHEVLAGNDWERWRPRVVLVEANGVESWEPMLLSADYHFAFFDGVTRFYVRGEDRRLLPVLSVPANAGDGYRVHGYVNYIEELEHRLSLVGDLTAGELKVAHWLHDLRRKHPRATSVIRPMMKRLVG
jgi:FkbM family methyltransferase